MPLPLDELAFGAPTAPFLLPDALPRSSRTRDYEMGGAELQQGQQGLRVQDWFATLVGTEVRLAKVADPDNFTVILTEAGITQLSISFDQNMNYVLAYLALNVAKLKWYNTSNSQFETINLGVGVRSPMLSMDDKRSMATSSNRNDVILVYIVNNRLCHRRQRDSYGIEMELAWFDGSLLGIRRVGMTSGLRMQFEITGMSNRLALGAVMASWREAIYMLGVTSITHAMPPSVKTGDLVYAAVMHRSSMSPPAGWTLQSSVACARSGLTQTFSLFKKTTPDPVDSGANVTFTQSVSERMGVFFFGVRATSGAPSLVGATSSTTSDVATNTIIAPEITAAGSELIVVLATTIEATASVTEPVVEAGLVPLGGSESQCRIGAAYQRISVGKKSDGRFTFDNGSPVNNGLAAMTLRFSTI